MVKEKRRKPKKGSVTKSIRAVKDNFRTDLMEVSGALDEKLRL